MRAARGGTGIHFVSLVAIVVFMLIGFSPVLSVFWATRRRRFAMRCRSSVATRAIDRRASSLAGA